jgi:signal transduction histidine kinase
MTPAPLGRVYREEVPHPPGIPAAEDLSLGLVAVAAGQAVVWGTLGSEPFYGGTPYNAVLSALMLGALAWWRLAPVAVLAWFVALFCFLQVLWPHDLPAWTGFFVMVFLTANAGYRAGTRGAVLSVLLALTGFTVLTLVEPTLQSLDHYVFDAAVILLPWLAARSLAVRGRSAERLAADLHALEMAQAEHQRQAVASERARIARELHDVVAHSVSVLVIQVASARVLLGDPSKSETVRKQLLGAEHVGREALDELRRLLGLLRQEPTDPAAGGPAPSKPQPGLDAIPALVGSFRDAGMDVALDVYGEPTGVSPGLALTIYRTVQEGLTNALKHAPAAPVRVRVGLLPAQVRVDVENALPGREPGHGPGTGHGLIGVRERVALFDGTCSAGPSGAGWALSVTLPRAGAPEVHATVSGA